jgi:cell division protein ZapA (FtsZ GTPase activity inhibitor)
MSAVDDIRKLLQDFLAPELRAISVCLDAIEARMNDRFAHMDQRFTAIDQRFTQLELQRQQDKQDILRAINALADYKTLSERVTRLESKEVQPH